MTVFFNFPQHFQYLENIIGKVCRQDFSGNSRPLTNMQNLFLFILFFALFFFALHQLQTMTVSKEG